MTLIEALDHLLNEACIGDFIYNIRDRVEDTRGLKSTWDHPRVKGYSDAIRVLEDHLADLRAND